MTVSAGVTSGVAVAALVGPSVASSQGVGPAAALRVVRGLPQTGANHIAVLVAIAMILLMAGWLAVGFANRLDHGPPADPGSPA